MLSWSGGKDSSLALEELRRNPNCVVSGLLTTVTRDYDRISMHGVRRSLLRQQASSIGVPAIEVFIPKGATNEIYEKEVLDVLIQLKEDMSVSTLVFGDLYLGDVREYREKLASKIGMNCIFPIWHRETRQLARQFVNRGFRAVLCTVNPRLLDPKFCGREFDPLFLSEIPATVDPCGENGEFHTFVYDGPIFKEPVKITRGEIVERDGFFFADLLPLEDSQRSG